MVVHPGVVTGQALINHYGISLTAKLTDFSGYLIFATAALLTVVCLACAQQLRLRRACGPSATIPATPAPTSGREVSNGWIFLLGLLLPIYTITGYDASAHTSEETAQRAPVGAARHRRRRSSGRACSVSCFWSPSCS